MMGILYLVANPVMTSAGFRNRPSGACKSERPPSNFIADRRPQRRRGGFDKKSSSEPVSSLARQPGAHDRDTAITDTREFEVNLTGFVRCRIAAVALSAVSACGGSTIAPSNATPNVRYVGAIATIDNVGGQGCTKKLYGYGEKTFWIVAGSDQITEYRVPQKPLKTLSVPAGIVIFKKATGTGTWIPTPLAQEYFDGYDAKGNLFFDDFTKASQFGLFEIARGLKRSKRSRPATLWSFPARCSGTASIWSLPTNSPKESIRKRNGGPEGNVADSHSRVEHRKAPKSSRGHRRSDL
jgi:hypothetical protein